MARKRPPPRSEFYSVNVGYPPSRPPQQYLPKILYPDRLEDETSFILGPPFEGWIAELVWKAAYYREKIVDWALMLDVIGAEDPINVATLGPRRRRRVERVDCCDSQIHRHLFTINSDPEDNDGEREPLRPLTENDADVVNQEFTHYYDQMIRHWPERVRRWRDG